MSNRRVMVHDVTGRIDLSGPAPKFVSANDRMAAADAVGTHHDEPAQALTGRDAFMQRQVDEWKRDSHTAEDGKSDSTDLDENSVARSDQTTGGLIAIAKQNAKNKAKASAAPTGRDLFMQRTSQAWRNEGAA